MGFHRMAFLRAESLSAMTKARRALSLRASCWRNCTPCDVSASASMWAGRNSSLHTEPGRRVCFPNAKTSGEYPLRMLKAFLA